jgi:hypothetical protein
LGCFAFAYKNFVFISKGKLALPLALQGKGANAKLK